MPARQRPEKFKTLSAFISERRQRLRESIICGRCGHEEHLNAATRLFQYGYQLERLGEHSEASAIYQEIQELLCHLQEATRSSLPPLRYIECVVNHGLQIYEFCRYRQARASFEEALSQLDALILNGVSSEVLAVRARCLRWLGQCSLQLGEQETASAHFAKAALSYRTLGSVTSDVRTCDEFDRMRKLCESASSKEAA